MGMLINFNAKMALEEDDKKISLKLDNFSFLDILADNFVEVAKSKGFYSSKNYEPDKDIAATHEEVSELRQAITKGKFNDPCDKSKDMLNKIGISLTCGQEEAADVIIQALKLARLVGIKNIAEVVFHKNEYNKTRPWRHGRK